ncbi:MAG: lamin tail domain-containing protein [Deltaproteobacteria bacterium]|nr:lamin tail domain-containing protein [Deltaproteobacteria bacterium]
MVLPSRSLPYAALALFGLGCSVYTEDLLLPASGSGGAAAAGGAGGVAGSGQGGGCARDSDCPGEDEGCRRRACRHGGCGYENAFLGAPCAESGGRVCDGAGKCVPCLGDLHCDGPERCVGQKCVPPACANVEQDGSETDVDCGGECPACANGKACQSAADCKSRHCAAAGAGGAGGAGGVVSPGSACAPCAAHEDCEPDEHCDNFGRCASKKPLGALCDHPEACSSGLCADGRCCDGACPGGCESCTLPGLEGTCTLHPEGTDPEGACGGDVCNGQGACRCADLVKNGAEADVDCGGGGCPPCADGKGCAGPSDCQSKVCQGAQCQAPICADLVQNAAETDVDCGGGKCPACADGKGCAGAGDCQSKVCQGAQCQAPTCGDQAKNAAETDVDCGGGKCPACADGKACLLGADCQSGFCGASLCKTPACNDGFKNGKETDVDCGGGKCSSCADGKGCLVGSDCLSGVCKGALCQAPVCGDAVVNGAEQCDDGNKQSFDACSASCRLPAPHLLLSELVVTPSDAEYVEIYNPTAKPVALGQIYLADEADYYLVAQKPAGGKPNQYDFRVRFPPGASLAPGAFAVVSLSSASAFHAAYGKYPDFDFDANDAGAPTMVGEMGANAGLANTSEMVVLFQWDGSSDLVADLDYVVYGGTAAAMDKSGLVVGAGKYKPETLPAGQSPAATPQWNDKTLHRCESAETGEASSGSNGLLGHDETSEKLTSSFETGSTASPGAPPPPGVCP